MKKVKGRHEKDCTAACLAALLEIDINDLPDFFNENESAIEFYDSVRKWLARLGWHFYYAQCHARQFAEFQRQRTPPQDSWPPRGYWIGQIARVEWIVENMIYHAVVMNEHRCVFNPNGTIKQTKENDVFLVGYYLLTPIDPTKFKLKKENDR